jgi:hypothetical protein
MSIHQLQWYTGTPVYEICPSTSDISDDAHHLIQPSAADENTALSVRPVDPIGQSMITINVYDY